MIINLIEFVKEEKIKLQIVGTEDQLIMEVERFKWYYDAGNRVHKYFLLFRFINKARSPYTIFKMNKSLEEENCKSWHDETSSSIMGKYKIETDISGKTFDGYPEVDEVYILPNALIRRSIIIEHKYGNEVKIPNLSIEVAGYDLERLN